MKEKTLRYPGHVEYIQVLKQSGFFNTKPVKINGIEISPLDFTSKILFDEWKLGEMEEELTIMRITIIGEDANGTQKKIVYNLHDKYCSETKTSSMARTTGYTATAVANMFLDRLFFEKGVFPPELIGDKKGVFEYILKYLRERKIIYLKEEF
ncbi:saccharopine dehydrogenase C-terminal domain-containing protein [Lutibacter sp.]|uniref:saccharopine dehydrogenase family protein n=1 Tax=Lutibacter sp. TaxID=1925666 RepID=UPI0034560305